MSILLQKGTRILAIVMDNLSQKLSNLIGIDHRGFVAKLDDLAVLFGRVVREHSIFKKFGVVAAFFSFILFLLAICPIIGPVSEPWRKTPPRVYGSWRKVPCRLAGQGSERVTALPMAQSSKKIRGITLEAGLRSND